MSRLRRIADRDRIFFVTTNLGAGIAHLQPAERDFVVAQLSRQKADRDFALFGYVVMPTHLHLLLAPHSLGLADAMQRLKRFTGQHIRAQRRLHIPVWQPRFYDFIVRRAGDFWDKLDYIHENPVAAKLVPASADWRWSSAMQYCPNGRSNGVESSALRMDKIDLPHDRGALLNPIW